VDHERLAGGNSNVVSRVGDTVHRRAGAWTPAVHRLLSTLRSAGVREVPEPLGFDADGREILSYIPGEAGNYPLPDWLWSPAILDEAGALLRKIHDASLPLVSQGLVWGSPTREPAEAICHNDAAPYNMAFVDGHVAGVFDFDAASPGPRIWDLAYLAYRLAPFAEDARPHGIADAERFARTDRLVRAYGASYTHAELTRTIAARLDALAGFTDERADATGRADLREHARMYRRDEARLTAISGDGPPGFRH
jgi:prepilin-type processing-associated H-X9-DG protein